MQIQSFMHRASGIDWYCHLQGDGPTVVLVPSGEGDCTPFDRVTAQLWDRARGRGAVGEVRGLMGRGRPRVVDVMAPCKHFPQVSIPDLLADHIRRSASRHLR